jgi:protein gp37
MKEFLIKYDEETLTKNDGKYPATIFIEHMNDLFSADTPTEFINRIMDHCKGYPENTYVFQTKNPVRMKLWLTSMPPNHVVGSTIETNREYTMSKAPKPIERARAMTEIKGRKFITIEPVLDFDVDILANWIANINPEFLNLGADSKGHGLPEPTVDKIMQFTEKLKEYGIELREKHNLKRLMKSC